MKRNLLLGAMSLTFLAACGDDKDKGPSPSGTALITVVDQSGEAMTDCDFDYRPNLNIFEEDTDGAVADPDPSGTLFIAEYIGDEPSVVHAVCDSGKLRGYVVVPELIEDEELTRDTRLIGSLCSFSLELDVPTPRATLDDPKIDLGMHLGFSDDLRCSNWLEGAEIRDFEITSVQRDCTGIPNCDPHEGSKFTEIEGLVVEPVFSEMNTNAQQPPLTNDLTIIVHLRQTERPYQELDVPVEFYKGP